MRKGWIAALLGVGTLGLGLVRYRRPLIARLLRLPPAQYEVAVEPNLRIPMPDGTALYADRYLPVAPRSFPTILIRTPYGREGDLGLFSVLIAMPARLFAARGYHVIVQTTRGRFRSEGDFDPLVHEASDGQATLDWVLEQPWFNGALGMWGPSYLGYVQWAVAANAPTALKALMPMITSSRFSRLFYGDGALTLDTLLRWLHLTHAMHGQHRYLDLAAARTLPASRTLHGLARELTTLPVSAADQATVGYPVPWYRNWIEQEDLRAPYWQSVDHFAQLGKVQAPVHLVAGWYDIFLHAQLTDYASLLATGRPPYLTIGPYHHLTLSLNLDAVREGLAWFDAQLKGETQQLRKRSVRIYVMGAAEWHEMDFWPPPAKVHRLYLQPAKGLAETKAPSAVAPSTYHYEPRDPTPSVGGVLMNESAGPQNQHALEVRRDVLTFTTEPLTTDLDVIGPVRLELFVRSSLAHTDFVGRLCDVHPDGASYNVCEGMVRLKPDDGEVQADGTLRVEIDLWATAQRFLRGHRIRLQVCSGAFPHWARNTGTGERLATAFRMVAADQLVYHDTEHPSVLIVPVVERAESGERRT